VRGSGAKSTAVRNADPSSPTAQTNADPSNIMPIRLQLERAVHCVDFVSNPRRRICPRIRRVGYAVIFDGSDPPPNPTDRVCGHIRRVGYDAVIFDSSDMPPNPTGRICPRIRRVGYYAVIFEGSDPPPSPTRRICRHIRRVGYELISDGVRPPIFGSNIVIIIITITFFAPLEPDYNTVTAITISIICFQSISGGGSSSKRSKCSKRSKGKNRFSFLSVETIERIDRRGRRAYHATYHGRGTERRRRRWWST